MIFSLPWMTWYSGVEVVLDVDAELALRQVDDVPDRRLHLVVAPEVLLERPRLGGRLDDDEMLGHGQVSAAGLAARARNYCPGNWRTTPAQLEHEQRLEHRAGRSRVRAINSSTPRGGLVELRRRRPSRHRSTTGATGWAAGAAGAARSRAGRRRRSRPAPRLGAATDACRACARRPARAPQRPRGPARRRSWAVISEPLRSVASTTTVPSDKPLMMRLRRGKVLGVRAGVPIGYSDTTAPF